MLMGLFPSVNRTDCKPRAPNISAWGQEAQGDGGRERRMVAHTPQASHPWFQTAVLLLPPMDLQTMEWLQANGAYLRLWSRGGDGLDCLGPNCLNMGCELANLHTLRGRHSVVTRNRW